MHKVDFSSLVLFLFSVFLASVSQVLLKKAALIPHKNVFQEYANWRVLLGYGLFFFCTLLTMLAYRGIPLGFGPVLETTGYVYVTFFGAVFFGEKLTVKKLFALGLIVAGIMLYTL